eukprot:Hpha_TRINITY_DN15503_c5_g1::TRINITY_DN15503_c5_g1_i1::g.104631::m.104631
MSAIRLKKQRQTRRGDGLDEKQCLAIDNVLFFDNVLKQPAGYSVAHLFDTVVPAFGFMKSAEYSAPRHIVKLLFTFEACQIISLGLSPRFQWGDVSNAIAHALYFQQLPFWDRRHIFAGYLPSVIIALVVSIVPIFLLALGVARTVTSAELPLWMVHYRRILYMLTTWLFIPIFQFQLSMLVCRDNVLWTNPDEQCDSALVSLVRAVCIIGAGSLFILTLLARTCLYESQPLSYCTLARSHSRADFVDFWIKAVACIMYHHFLARGEARWFGLFIVFAFILGGAYWCYSYPYYRSKTLIWRVAPLWMGAWCGALAAMLETEAGNKWLREGQRDFVMLIVGLVIAFILAVRLRDYRINPDYSEGMHVLRTYGRIIRRNTPFPQGLEASPEQFKVHEELENALLPPEDEAPGGTRSEELRASYHFTVPCVGRVHTASDCQIACRFVREYQMLTNQMPTRPMYLYALRIYLRGTMVFKDSSELHLAIAKFIVYHLRYETAAMRWLQAVENTEATLSVRYQAWKLMQLLKVDNTYMERFERAKRNHLECLRQMHDFWKTIQAEHVDQGAMNVCASGIHSNSDSALSEYMHALRLDEGDRPLVRSDVPLGVDFGLFLEQVLGSQDLSERCYQTMTEFSQNSKTKAMAGARRKPKDAADIGVNQLPSLNEVKHAGSGGENREQMDQITGRSAIKQAQLVLNGVFCFLVLLISIFLVLTAVTTERRKLVIEACSAAGEVRALASEAMLVAFELAHSNPKYPPQYATISPEGLSMLRENPYPREVKRSQLLGLTRDLQTRLNEVTWGSKMPSFGPPEMLQKMWTKPYLDVDLLFNESLTSQIREGKDEMIRESVWTAMYNLVERLYQIQNTPLDKISPKDHNIKYIEKNGLASVTDGLNRTLGLYEEWNERESLIITLCLVAIFSCSIVLVALVFVLLVTRFRGVERTRRNVREVVTLVPLTMMKKLEEQVYRMIHEFVKFRDRPEFFLTERRYLDTDPDKTQQKLVLRTNLEEDYAKEVVTPGGDTTDDAMIALEDNRRAQRDRIKAEQALLSVSTFSMQSKVLFLILSVLAIGELTASVAIRGGWDAIQLESMRTQEIEMAQRTVSIAALQLELEAEEFVVMRNEKYYKDYLKKELAVMGDPTVYRSVMEYNSPCCQTLDNSRFQVAMHQLKHLIENHLVAMGLAAQSLLLTRHGAKEDDFHRAMSYDPFSVIYSNTGNVRIADTYQRAPLADSAMLHNISTNKEEAATTYLALAISQLFSDSHLALYDSTLELFNSAYDALWDSSHHRLEEKVSAVKLLYKLDWVAIVLSVGTIILLMVRQAKEKFMSKRFVVVTIAIYLTLSTLSLILTTHDYQEYVSTITKRLELQLTCDEYEREAVASALLAGRDAMVFTQTGDAYRWKLYKKHIDEPERLLHLIEEFAVENIDDKAEIADVENAFTHALKDLKMMHRNEEIAFAMGYHAFPEKQKENYAVEKLTWTQEDYNIIPASTFNGFINDVYHFTNETYDLKKWTTEEMKILASRTIFGTWYRDIYERFTKDLHHGAEIVCKSMKKKVDDRVKKSRILKDDVIYFTVAKVIVAFVIFVNILRAFIFTNADADADKSVKSGKGKSSSNRSTSDALTRHIRSVAVALGLVACLISIIFALCYMQIADSKGVARRLQESSARSWLVSRSMTLADELVYDSRIELKTMGYLEETWAHLREAEWNLFFHDFRGDSSGTYSGVASDAAQSKLLFGPESSIPSASLYECNASMTAEVNYRVRGGVSLLYQDWKDGILYLLRRQDDGLTAHEILHQRTLLLPLLEGIRESSKLYTEEATAQQDSAFLVIVAVSLTSMLLILIVFFLVFRPLTKELEREEMTTRLVLRMIPQECRELPDIVELLEMHNVGQREEHDNHIAQAISELSPYPLIAIDEKGVVLKATGPPLKEVFGYQANEIVGTNVRVLMPQRIAQNHDQYLANYRRTGQRHKHTPIDKLRGVVGLRKDGTEFEGSLLVRQHICESGEKVFIGCLRDVTQTTVHRLETKANECIRELSVAGLFVADESATIRKVNKRACEMFGWARADLEGSSLNVLMPPEVANVHASYLARARQNPKPPGQITIIKRQTALTKSGTRFEISVKVQQIVHMRGVIYVAELFDLTEQDSLGTTSRVSDSIANLSSVPVVVIDPKGTVLRFSDAAEQAFKYPARSVLGKNVKMLMSPEIAIKHDGFLQRYQETGIKYVVGTTREVMGRKSDGQAFPVKISVSEISQPGVPQTFVGYCQDITMDVKNKKQEEIAGIVERNSAIPIITINNMGEVLTFSKMACIETQYTEEEVVGQNINRLMPPGYSEKHDGYLEAYRKTGIKKVIGDKRLVVVMRKDSSTFRALLRPYEIVAQEKTCDNVYVGFLSNQENALMLGRTFLVNEAVSDISPVPMIVINHLGIVRRFSQAAVLTWGYETPEVMGNNVKKLMPPTIAEHHDGYLSRYLRTGVKVIIDSKKKATAVRKNGSEFPVEISVREVKKEGSEPSYVGYVRDISQDEALARGEQLGEQIRENSPVPLLVIDSFGMVVSCNKAMIEEFYFTKEELVGHNVKMLMPQTVATKHDDYLLAFRQTGRKKMVGATTRQVGKRKNLTRVPLDVTICEFTDTQGTQKSTHFVGYLRDMTSAIELEEATRAVDVVVNLSSVPVIAIDHRGLIIKFSAAAEKVFRYAATDVLGQNVNILMPDETRRKHDRALVLYRRTGKKTAIDSMRMQPAVTSSGENIQVELCVREVIQEGRDSVYVGYMRDAREDFLVQQEEAMINNIRDLSSAPVILMDTQGTITEWNTAAQSLFGFTRDDVVGKFNSITKIQPPDTAANHQSYIDAYLKTGIKKVIDTLRRVTGMHESGKPIPLELSIREMVREGGGRTFIGYIRDLSDELEQEQQKAVSDAVCSLAVHPLIVIDHIGTIKKFSSSAERVWGYTEKELKGGNIKRIMPERFSVNHDMYLQRYQDTGVKTVVDTLRTVAGRRMDGSEFPCTIAVKEVKMDKSASMFVGYAMDATEAEALALSRRVAESVSEHASVPVIQMSQVGIVQKFNKSAGNVFMYDPSAVIGKNIKMLMPEEYASQHDFYLSRYMSDGIKRVIGTKREASGRRSDGSQFPVELSIVEMTLDASSRVFLGYVRDITTMYVLQQATAVNDAITAISPIPVIAISAKGLIFKFSAAASQLFGYSFEEIQGKNVSMLMPDKIRVKHDGYLKRYQETREKKVVDQITTDLQGKKKDGTLFPVEISIKELVKEGQESIFVGSLRDYTQDEVIHNSLQLARAIMDASALPIMGITPKGIIHTFSKSAEQCFGYSADQVIGQQIETLMPQETAIRHQSFLDAYMKTGIKHVIDTERRVTAMNSDGQEFPFLLKVKELIMDGEKIFVGYAEDLRAEEEMSLYLKIGSVIESMIKAAIISIDHVGIIQSFNETASDMFEFSESEVIGRNCKILMPEEISNRHDAILERYQAFGERSETGPLETPRIVTAESKQGFHFKVEILVKELKPLVGPSRFVARLSPIDDGEL